MPMSRFRSLVSLVARLTAATILCQTLFFKFTGAPESVYIFSTLGMEPAGRILSGVAELVACVLLLVPSTSALGGLLSLGVISGALASHLTVLGIEVKGDGGLLFFLAILVFVASAAVVALQRKDLLFLGRRLGLPVGKSRGGGSVPRVLILGGGFGGLYAALELEKALAQGEEIEVTLVNKENFFLFTPMLHEVAASDLDLTNIVSPVRKLLKRVSFFEGEVVGVDLKARTATLAHGFTRHHHTVAYDHIVIALGSSTNFFGLPGLSERALTMKSLGDAIHLRNRLIAFMEEADTECCASVRAPLMTFVVAGGGFAGVETIAGINDFVRESLRFYPNLREEQVRMVLVHPGKVILPELGESLGLYAQGRLSRRGVEIRTQTRVMEATDEGIRLSDDTVIPSRTLIWTAGTTPNPLLADLPCVKEKGRLRVDEQLQVEGFPGVWALGDCAMVPDRRTGQAHPPTAQHALREGRIVAHNVLAALRGGRPRPFDFAALGQLAAIGRRTGVARVLGLNFSGFTAWWLWRTIYLGKLPRFEKKLRVALDWTLDLFFSKDLVQYLGERAQAVAGARGQAGPEAMAAPAPSEARHTPERAA